MLRDIWAPSDLLSVDKDPSVPVEDKLKIIHASPVQATLTEYNGSVFSDDFSIALPFITGGSFYSGLGEARNILFCDFLSLGDKTLEGNGIGTRLLRAAFRYAVEADERTDTFSTGWIRLGAVNTVVKVVGEENVGVRKKGNTYGLHGEKPLEAVFDDFPPVADTPYLFYKLTAQIDREAALTGEAPIVVNESAVTKSLNPTP